MCEPKSSCPFIAIKEAAEELDFSLVQKLYAENPSVHMANMSICGAGTTFEQYPRDSPEAKSAMEILKWAMSDERKEGKGDLLFFERSAVLVDPTYTPQKKNKKSESFFTRVSMRKGPGDIAKGTFNKSLINS